MLRGWKLSLMSQLNTNGQPEPVSFAQRLVGSPQFDRLFAEGMALVERTAAYLDKQGRADARKLAQPISIAYATESMRLTTRLLELASWLLIRRSLRDGGITAQEAAAKRARIKLGGSGRPSHNAQFEALPDTLRGLVAESFLLADRIRQLDLAIDGGQAAPGNPIGDQRARIESAFAGRPRLVVSN